MLVRGDLHPVAVPPVHQGVVAEGARVAVHLRALALERVSAVRVEALQEVAEAWWLEVETPHVGAAWERLLGQTVSRKVRRSGLSIQKVQGLGGR